MSKKRELDKLRSNMGVASLEPGCAECEETGDGVEVYWDADGKSYEGPDLCPKCGRQLVVDVCWPDVERGPEER